jgi:hypothetical protein
VESTNSVLAEKGHGEWGDIGIADKTVESLKEAIAPLRDFAIFVRDALISVCPAARVTTELSEHRVSPQKM